MLIGDVDCTSEDGKSVCSDHSVSGYPTIKYFTESTGRGGSDYTGGRDFDTLNKFVEDELQKECNAKTKDSCNDKEVAYIDKMIEQGKDKWAAEATRLGGLQSQPASKDKRTWLLKRLSILEQLLGKKTPRARRMRLSTKIAIALGAVGGVVLLNVLLLRRWHSRKAGTAPEESAGAPAEAKKQAKEEEAKQD